MFGKLPIWRTRWLTILGLGAVVPGVVPVAGHAQDQSHTITVVVRNHAFYDAHIYAVQSGIRRSLGLTPGVSERRFELPPTFVESIAAVHLVSNPIGPQAGYVSPSFYLDVGDQLNLTLENNPAMNYSVVSDQARPSRDETDGDAPDGDASDGDAPADSAP